MEMHMCGILKVNANYKVKLLCKFETPTLLGFLEKWKIGFVTSWKMPKPSSSGLLAKWTSEERVQVWSQEESLVAFTQPLFTFEFKWDRTIKLWGNVNELQGGGRGRVVTCNGLACYPGRNSTVCLFVFLCWWYCLAAVRDK